MPCSSLLFSHALHHVTFLMFCQSLRILCGTKNKNLVADCLLPPPTLHMFIWQGVLWVRLGARWGANRGPVREITQDSPSDRRSSSRGFLRGCWCGGSTRWRFFSLLAVWHVKIHDTAQILKLSLVDVLKRIPLYSFFYLLVVLTPFIVLKFSICCYASATFSTTWSSKLKSAPQRVVYWE